MADPVGLEPTTIPVTAEGSAIELQANKSRLLRSQAAWLSRLSQRRVARLQRNS